MTDLAANADEIAKFFSGANPNLTESAVKGLFVVALPKTNPKKRLRRLTANPIPRSVP